MDRILRPVFLAVTLATLLVLPSPSSAQTDPDDIYWDRRFPAIGVNGTVNAVARLGNDVFLGGNFSEAGGISALNVARWNSSTYRWSALGSGIRGQILAVAAIGQYVYVGGVFDRAGGVEARNIARFDLQSGQWSAIMDGSINGLDGAVRVLTVNNGALYVGGDFQKSGNLASPCLARFNPGNGTWERMVSTIVAFSVADPSVSAVAFNGTDMYIGGQFDRIDGVNGTNVMRKTTTAWEGLGPAGGSPSGVDGRVHCFAFRTDEIYIGGEFKQATQQGTNLFLTSNICYWRPSTRSYEPLMPNGTNTNYNPRGTITSMLIWRGFLYASGQFTDAGGELTGGFARYDFSRQRQAFRIVGKGIEGNAFALADLDDAILLAGDFPRAGGITAAGAALWTDEVYTPLTNVPDNGTNGPVAALVSIGSDLYVGGTFTVAGGRAARNIAGWDGASWSPLGSGVDGPVYAVAVMGSDLYVGGRFANAGGVAARNIARYNTTTGTWSALGTGLPGTVYALAVNGGTLFAGGGFSDATFKFIAGWTGGAWVSPGTGLSDTARCMVAAGGTLFVGGDFASAGGIATARVARWTGSAWQAMGSGLSGGVGGLQRAYAMAVDGNDIIVAGDFTDAGGIGSPYAARWSRTLNTWGPLGPGAGRGLCDVVRAVAVNAGRLYLGGRFLLAGSTSVNYVVEYDGSRFVPLGGDLENGVNDVVSAITVSSGLVYVGGVFSSTADGFANRVASYTGGTWSPLGGTITAGLNQWARAIAVDGENVYVGGNFTATGTSVANRIIRWSNAVGAWSTLGPGLDGPVYAMALAGGKLYVGGDFITAGGLPARNIAVWDIARRRWETLGDVRDNGVDGPVRAIAVSGSNIYIGGEFTRAGDSAGFNRIAVWNGDAASWQRLSNGADSTVLAIGISGGNIYVGGYFFRMDGLPASHFARWETRNNRWQRLGSGTNAPIRAIAVEGDNVYIGGDFATAGTISARRVARWDNATDFYDYVGNDDVGGTSVDARVHALSVRAGILYVGGEFTRIGSDSGYNNIARWTRATGVWKKFGSGITGESLVPSVTAIGLGDADMYIGGWFDRAGGNGSYYFAHWEGALNRPAAVPGLPPAAGWLLEPRPNPATTDIHLPLHVQTAISVRIELIDPLGRIVAVPYDAVLEQGEHLIDCDLRSLSEGFYIVRAIIGDAVSTRTLVVAR